MDAPPQLRHAVSGLRRGVEKREIKRIPARLAEGYDIRYINIDRHAGIGVRHREKVPEVLDALIMLHVQITKAHTFSFRARRRSSARPRQRRRLDGSLREDANVESMYFISTLPWLHYSALIQPVAGGEESNPRITWGAFAPDAEGRLQMPVTLLVHHALADGLHISRFFENLRRKLDAITNDKEI